MLKLLDAQTFKMLKLSNAELLKLLGLTSSGSVILYSQPSPVQDMKCWQFLSLSSSRMNCHSWIGPVGVIAGVWDVCVV